MSLQLFIKMWLLCFFERWQAARLDSWHFNKRWNWKHATQALKSVHWRILKYKMQNMPCWKHPPTLRPHVSKQIVKSSFGFPKGQQLIEIIPYYYCHDLLVLVSVSPESAVPSYKSKIPLQSNPFILFPSSILTTRRLWRRKRLISRSDWPLMPFFWLFVPWNHFSGWIWIIDQR